MATGTRQCLHCGKELMKKQVWRNCQYCSMSCYHSARFGEIIQDEIPYARNPLCLEAIKLCQSGLNKREAARLVGIKQHILIDWFYRYGAENEAKIFSDRVCEHCGKSLLGMKNLSSRKYCSKSCSWKATYLKNHPEMQRMRFDPELRAKALEMYWGGLEGAIISRYLSVADGTVRSWIHDFGHLQKRKRNPEAFALLPIRDRLGLAESPKEWRSVLGEFVSGSGSDSFILVCGNYDVKGEINYLATIVSDILGRNPCDGKTYAFCGSRGKQVVTVCWSNGTFCFTRLPKSQGSYIWPEAKVGQQIELRKNEFEYLLSLRKKQGSKSYLS